MKRHFSIFLILILLLVLFASIMMLINESQHDDMLSMWGTIKICRLSINLYHEQNGKYPDSLRQLEEYAAQYPEVIKSYSPPGESVSSHEISFSEHNILDGTGGIFYDPNTGNVKINITKPLKSYWIFYFCEGRNDVPADW